MANLGIYLNFFSGGVVVTCVFLRESLSKWHDISAKRRRRVGEKIKNFMEIWVGLNVGEVMLEGLVLKDDFNAILLTDIWWSLLKP